MFESSPGTTGVVNRHRQDSTITFLDRSPRPGGTGQPSLLMDVTVIIPTLDERLHIERAVASARLLGPVFIVDAQSTDGTQVVASAAGATVLEHPWSGYSAQKNWALDHLPIETEWVLFLDADEFVMPALREEIGRAVKVKDVDGYWIPEMNIFFGRRLSHAWWYPAYQLRLFRHARARYEEREVHESVVLNGRAGFLKEPLYHENLKGIDPFIQRHLRYAESEAKEMMRLRTNEGGLQRRGRLLGSWPERRRYLKLNVWYRMPARPAIRFLWMYLVKRGFLDGREGRVYCELLAAQEALINAKLLELEFEQGRKHPRGGVGAD
jgi:glycosyltransferase involved in cell wall biosynthesis